MFQERMRFFLRRPPGAISKWWHVLSTILELYPISAKTRHTPSITSLVKHLRALLRSSPGWSWPCLKGHCLQRRSFWQKQILNPSYVWGRGASSSRCFQLWPTCQSWQSVSSRYKSPLLTLFSSQAGLARWVVPKVFNSTFNALPVMVCKHFPKWSCLKLVVRFFFFFPLTQKFTRKPLKSALFQR